MNKAISLALLVLLASVDMAHARMLKASSTTTWKSAVFYISGLPVVGVPSQVVQPDGSILISQDVPALILPATISLIVTSNDGRVFNAVLPNGKPGPMVMYPDDGCRADLDNDGAVGLPDVSMSFSLASKNTACLVPDVSLLNN